SRWTSMRPASESIRAVWASIRPVWASILAPKSLVTPSIRPPRSRATASIRAVRSRPCTSIRAPRPRPRASMREPSWNRAAVSTASVVPSRPMAVHVAVIPDRDCSTGVRHASLGHPNALGLLVPLALGLDGGGDHDLGLLELPDVGVAGRGHGGAKGAEQVKRAVVLVGGTHQDLAQRSDAPGRDAG